MKKSILSLFLLLGLLSTPLLAQDSLKEIEFEHIFDETFVPNMVRGINWMEDGRYFTTLSRAGDYTELWKFDIVEGDAEVLLSEDELKDEEHDRTVRIEDYQFSSGEKKVLIKTDVESIWRRSTRENYYIYDFEAERLSRMTDSDEKQQYGQLSPQGDKAAYVQNNNLFWVDLESGEEIRITGDGEFNRIINGAADWVYEEEFGFAKAWFWSPDGSRIAFYRFDESEVKEFSMTEWGGLYPELTRFKYPKAGEQNSTVKIGVYDLDDRETVWMDVGDETDQYIPRINWTKDSELLAIRRMNRLQNRQDLMMADVETGATEIIKTEESDAWIDVNDDLTFLENGEQFIYASEEDGNNHLYLYQLDGSKIRQITKGDWEVTNFVGYDENEQFLYYTGTEESPLERHFYRIDIEGERKEKLSPEPGWNSVNMSKDRRYFILTHSDTGRPYRFTLHENDGEGVRVLEENKALENRLDEYAMPEKEYFQIDLSHSTLNAYMLKPHDFDDSKEYPVLVYVYGGPGSQTVTRQFEVGDRAMWHRYLTGRGYIVVSVDNRGTGARGRDFEKQVYRKLGQYETEDQIEAAEYLVETYDFIDDDRLGIWGWSYGGYMSSLVLAEGRELFKAAIAVAPVTHWKFYDTIYTERFMQTPQQNPQGYQDGSPLNAAGNIEGQYLLVHGTGDDNVHFQNTVEMVDKLIEEGVQFQTMYYPNRNHGIYGGNTKVHLYEMMNNFILNNL